MHPNTKTYLRRAQAELVLTREGILAELQRAAGVVTRLTDRLRDIDQQLAAFKADIGAPELKVETRDL